MSDPAEHSLEARRRRIHFRAWRRGMREMDLILGRFADARLLALDEPDLVRFEALLDLPDPDLYRWIAGGEPAPDRLRSDLLAAIIAFHHAAGAP